MKIGVLALQGGFAEHIKSLQSIGAETFEIRKKQDLNQPVDGLVIPGGESTVISKLLDDLDLFVPLKEKIDAGLPVFGTCAGLILLANRFHALDVVVKRNAYGRQLGSFSVEAEMKGIGKSRWFLSVRLTSNRPARMWKSFPSWMGTLSLPGKKIF